MFGLSFTHLILLAVIALVVLGPEQLPEVARTIARLLNEWKRATSDIQTSLHNTLREENIRHQPEQPMPPAQEAALDAHAPAAEHAVEPAPHGHHDGDHVSALPIGSATVSDEDKKS